MQMTAGRTDDPDYDDENFVVVDFSKVSHLSRGPKGGGLAGIFWPLRVTVDGENAICVERVLISPRPNQRGKRPAIRKDSISFQLPCRFLDCLGRWGNKRRLPPCCAECAIEPSSYVKLTSREGNDFFSFGSFASKCLSAL